MKNIHASNTKNNFTTLVICEAKKHRVSTTQWVDRFCPSAFEYSDRTKKRLSENEIRKNKVYPHCSEMLRGTSGPYGKGTDKFKINISGCASDVVVGIKFVNIFSGFLFQFSNTQGQTVSVQIFDDGVSIDNYVTAKNVLVEANRSNEPSVLCQSTFN